MDAYNINPPLWDFQGMSTLSNIPNEDFLAMLQKGYPGTNNLAMDPTFDFQNMYAPFLNNGGINPQNLSNASTLPALSPPSDDSSPSPPPTAIDDDSPGNELKRKVSNAADEDFEEGPSSKSQHTLPKKGGANNTKRKTSGAPPEDARLMKRKEQNRAAQRAFRERKERHVKDLEDQVAALEAKNSEAVSENENLKDLLSRLQTENMALKQSSFTFAVPKNAGSSASLPSPATTSYGSPQTQASYNAASPPRMTNLLDMSSLTAFDENVLQLLDDQSPNQFSSQQTATSAAGSLADQYGFGNQNSGFFGSNVKTIASNPMFLSLSSIFEDPIMPIANPSPPNQSPPVANPSTNGSLGTQSGGMYDFDMNALSSWPGMTGTGSFSDDLFGGQDFLNPPYMAAGNSNISPILHHQSPDTNMWMSPAQSVVSGTASFGHAPSLSSSSSASSSPDSNGLSANTSTTSLNTESSPSCDGSGKRCPKDKEGVKKCMEAEGPSMFAQMPGPSGVNGLSGRELRGDSSVVTNNYNSNGFNPYEFNPHFNSTAATTTVSNGFDTNSMASQPTCSANSGTFDWKNIAGPMAGGGVDVLAKLGLISPNMTHKSIMCQAGVSKLPTTEKSDQNVEVLQAWKQLRNNPNFKDADINNLCQEFSSKAKCDGSKVVLDPQGVNEIMEGLNSRNHLSLQPTNNHGFATPSMFTMSS